MDFEPCLKVHSLNSVQHYKGIKLDQMIHLNLIFHVVVSNDLKLAPVPCATSKWPITRLRCRINEIQIYLVNKVVDISASSVIS